MRPVLRRADLFLPVLLAATLLPRPAPAHRLYVFAWGEDGQICGEGYYNKRSKASDALLEVRDELGNVLLRGRTDADGRFCFARPGEADLVIAVSAEQGHRGEFKLPARKGATAPPTTALESPAPSLPPSPPEKLPAPPPPQEAATPQKDLLQSLIREELQRALPPLLERSMAEFARTSAARREEREAEPGLRDIVGGLGWIAGLGALFAFCRSRRAS